jgi:hypothetical protein
MEVIRNDDILHLWELIAFLDLEINFAQQYLEVLKDVRSDWSYGWALSISNLYLFLFLRPE